jgi:outer membrane biosynthesis protein TonB
MTLNELTEFVRSCDRNVYNLMAQTDSAPSDDEVELFEKQIGFSFPKEYREFLTHPLGGLAVEVDEKLWPRPKPGDVGAAWSFCFGVYALSLASDAPEWISMQKAWAEMCELGHPELVPVLRVATDADAYCFTDTGELVIFRHETPDNADPVEGGFFDALMHELNDLEERKNLKLEGQESNEPSKPSKTKPKPAAAKPTKAKSSASKPTVIKSGKAKAKTPKAKPARPKAAKAKPIPKTKPAKPKAAQAKSSQKAKSAKTKAAKPKPSTKAQPAKTERAKAKPTKTKLAVAAKRQKGRSDRVTTAKGKPKKTPPSAKPKAAKTTSAVRKSAKHTASNQVRRKK